MKKLALALSLLMGGAGWALQTFNAAYLGKLGPAMAAMQAKIQQRVGSEIAP